MKYYYLLLIIPLFCSCFNKEKEDTQKISNLKEFEKNDTISFNDLLEIKSIDILPVAYLNENGEEKTCFSLNDTFKIKIEYSPKVLDNKSYRFSIKPISKGLILIKSLSKNVFLATINDKDLNDKDEVFSVFDVFIESDDICFKVKDGQKPIYYYSHKQKLRQKILKFKKDTL